MKIKHKNSIIYSSFYVKAINYIASYEEMHRFIYFLIVYYINTIKELYISLILFYKIKVIILKLLV